MKRRGERGFSLLEVLSAMTLFALVAAAVGALATTSMVYTIQNKHATTAAQLAQRELEDLRALPYSSIAGGTSTTVVAGQSYTIITSVQQNVPAAGMSSINVQVNWTGPEGARSYAVNTIYTAVNGE
jgi:prepilin-type N-terminal cleavage/methylation domain-containing protein